jgi:hypothetical protein
LKSQYFQEFLLISQLKVFIKDPQGLAIPNWAKLKMFGVFKARTNQLSLEIPIFSGVPAGFSAQKYSCKALKVLQSQIEPN